jgi:hypothetical protein
MEVSGQLHPLGKSPRQPLDREDWLAHRAGLDDVEKRKFLSLPRLEPRPSSPSLYRLSYPVSSYAEEFHNVYSSTNVIKMIKLKRIR